MSNADMKPGRYARWATARRKVAWIRERIAEGRTVYLSTALRQTKIDARHVDALKATRTGLYVRSGSRWLCYDGAQLSAR